MKETSQRRVPRAQKRISARKLEKKETSGCELESFAIDSLLEEAMRKHGGNVVEKNLPRLIREYISNDISGVLRSKIRSLQERLDAGDDPPHTQMMLRITLRSKKKILEDQQGSRPGTPPSSDDEEEDDPSENYRCLIPTSTPPSSDNEDDEEVDPVVFINKAAEQHQNSHYTIEQNRRSIVLSTKY